MTREYNKKLMPAGILLILLIVTDVVTLVYYHTYLEIVLITLISDISLFMIALYCMVFQLEKVVCFGGFGLQILVILCGFITGYMNSSDKTFLFLAICCFMILTKIKSNKVIDIILVIGFTWGILTNSIEFIYNILHYEEFVSYGLESIVHSRLLRDLYYIFQIAAFVVIWYQESKVSILKKVVKKPDSMQEKLRFLKEQYVAGKLTEQEYNDKKAEILSKL